MPRTQQYPVLPPVVGMAATYVIGGDRHPMIVTKVDRTGRRVEARSPFWRDDVAPNVYTLRRDGRYVIQGSGRAGSLYLGEAQDRRDPSF